jgi:monofunctional biosynthetic peptidoglycan transglycosylase
MARKTSKSKTKKTAKSKVSSQEERRFRPVRWVLLWLRRVVLLGIGFAALAIAFYAFINPPTTPYMFSEGRRLGGVDQVWVPIEEIAPVMMRSAVAAEDANFCNHWGLDLNAIQAAIEAGGGRGASTITQQVVKKVYLRQGRNWFRKVVEALMTPAVEAVWTKQRILEVYLNIAEFDEGVFGIEAAARHYFGVGPGELSALQAARLAAILPSPKTRSASNPTEFVRQRTRQIMDGAATIQADGRADCFQH